MADQEPQETRKSLLDQLAGAPGAEAAALCYACGTCSAGCPVRRVNPRFNPRKIVRMILLDMTRELLEGNAVWLCSSCYTCQERCPQEIRVTDLITAVRNLAVETTGRVPSGVAMQADLIRSQGRLYALDEFDDKKRKKAGLPSVPSLIDEAAELLKEEQ